MNDVKVLSKSGESLMPTTVERANKLIGRGEARLIDSNPMTIEMLKGTKHYMQKVLQDSYPAPNNSELNVTSIPLGVADFEGTERPLCWLLRDEDPEKVVPVTPSTGLLVTGKFNEGTTLFGNTILSHVSKHSDVMSAICSSEEVSNFSNLRGTKGISAILTDSTADAMMIDSVKDIMLERFKLMENCFVNNIDKLDGKEVLVDWYSLCGRDFQFDEFLEVDTIITTEHHTPYFNYQVDNETPDGDYTTVALTVRDIYEKLASQEVPYLRLHNQILGYSRYITLKDIVKKQDNFRKKYLIVYYDDFSRIMYSDDYRAVDEIKHTLVSIVRLGRSAGIFVVISAQRASASVISIDLFNNITMKVLLGPTDVSASYLMFDADVTDQLSDSQPEMPKGCVENFGKIYKFQTFDIDPMTDFCLDESTAFAQQNPAYTGEKVTFEESDAPKITSEDESKVQTTDAMKSLVALYDDLEKIKKQIKDLERQLRG